MKDCGLPDVEQNARIVGGIAANPYSWPSQVFIIQSVKLDYTFPDNKTQTILTKFQCGGTLIDRNTILTSAHCFIEEISYKYNGNLYVIPIKANKYYNTTASMFKLYLGIQETIYFNKIPALPGIVIEASKVLKVRHFQQQKKKKKYPLCSYYVLFYF
jgi:hypothetical protein